MLLVVDGLGIVRRDRKNIFGGADRSEDFVQIKMILEMRNC